MVVGGGGTGWDTKRRDAVVNELPISARGQLGDDILCRCYNTTPGSGGILLP